MEPFEIDVASIHYIDGAWLGDQLVEDIHVVDLPIGHPDEGGDTPAQVQERVQLDGCLAASEMRPGEEGEA